MIPTCTIGHSLIRVDTLVEVAAIEEILQQLLDLGDTRGAAHQNNVMDLGLVQLSIPQGFLHRLEGSTEQVCIQLFKTGSGDRGVEVRSFVEGVDLNAGLGAAGEGALCTLTGRAQATHGTLVVGDFLLELAFELCNEVVDHAIVEVFATQMSVTSCGLDLKNAILNGQNGHIKRSPSKVKDEDITFTTNLKIDPRITEWNILFGFQVFI